MSFVATMMTVFLGGAAAAPTSRKTAAREGRGRCRTRATSPNEENTRSSSSNDELDSSVWREAAVPQYMQESVEATTFCDLWEDAKRRQPLAKKTSTTLWSTLRQEAERDARNEPLLSSFLFASILSHESFERSLAFILANRLANTTLLATELFELFYETIKAHEVIRDAAQADLCALRERDPACRKYSQALLYFKGYHAIQVQRIAHVLWKQNRKVMAAALQSRSSEVFAVDIHPAAKIGKGVLLDHGTGVVIGETAEIGNNVSILQNVTLGGTGKQHGDRHPKIRDNVLIGASATILGAITIGKGSQVAAGSLVLKPVDPKTMVAGSPAKPVGRVQGNPALTMEQWYGSRVPSVSGMGSAGLGGGQGEDEDCVDVFVTAGTSMGSINMSIDESMGGRNGSGPSEEDEGQSQVADPLAARDRSVDAAEMELKKDVEKDTTKDAKTGAGASQPDRVLPGPLDSMDWVI